MNSALLATAGTIIGIIAGGLTVTWTAKDRMEREIEKRVTTEVTVATRIARLDERLKGVEDTIKTLSQNKPTATP